MREEAQPPTQAPLHERPLLRTRQTCAALEEFGESVVKGRCWLGSGKKPRGCKSALESPAPEVACFKGPQAPEIPWCVTRMFCGPEPLKPGFPLLMCIVQMRQCVGSLPAT